MEYMVFPSDCDFGIGILDYELIIIIDILWGVLLNPTVQSSLVFSIILWDCCVSLLIQRDVKRLISSIVVLEFLLSLFP